VHTEFSRGDLKERVHLEDLDIEGRIVLKWVVKNRMGGVVWSDLA